MIWDLTIRDSPAVQHALTQKCEVCRAKVGQDCADPLVIQGKKPRPLPGGRIVHIARATA